MFLARDFRETRVYQEGVEEGIALGIAILAAKNNMPAADIAAILEVDIALVRQVIEGAAADKSA
jgi:predicted transposase YdaD